MSSYSLRKALCATAIALVSFLGSSALAQNSALRFNGLSDHIKLTTTSATNLTSGFTLEAWTLSTTSTASHRIISNWQQSPSRGWGFGTRNVNYRFTTFGVKDHDALANGVTTGTWTHIAMTFAADRTVTFYRDGVLHGTVMPGNVTRESTHTLHIGGNPPGTEFWQGDLDEVRIWDHVRTPQQIADHHNRTLSGTEVGLLGYYPFDEGSGTTTADGSPNNGDGEIIGCTWVTGPTLLETLTKADPGWLQQP